MATSADEATEPSAAVAADPDEGGVGAGLWPGYHHIARGILYVYVNRKGEVQKRLLSNWTAEIVADITRDDGSPTLHRTFEVQVRQGDRLVTTGVVTDQLPRVQDWVLNGLGSTAQVSVFPSVQHHLLVAIQEASPNPARRTVFAHTGWRQIGGRPLFLHGGGAIGADGAHVDVETSLPLALRPFELPIPPMGAAERESLRSALGLLDLAPDRVTAAVFGAAWRAPLGESQLTVWVTGPTGAGKSELTALAQQHFGPGFTPQRLPAAWSGTGNSINELAYLAKDLLLVVDDFVPKGPASAVGRLHATAEMVIRAQGNGAGRSRLDAESSLRDSRPPRATLLATGEDVPHGQSLRGRMMVVDLGPRELDFVRLTAAQRAAREGVLAMAMSGYVQWLAAHPERLTNVSAEIEELRDGLLGVGSHRRTATIVAETALGWRTVLDYALDCGALSPDEAEAAWLRVRAALVDAGDQQGELHADSDPAERFLELVGAALSSGRAHLATVQGNRPEHAQRWGWREDNNEYHSASRALGERIGYVEDDEVFLLPDAVMLVVQTLGGTGEPISISKTSLGKRLHERGILLADEKISRGTLTVRKTAEKRRHKAWHLHASSLGVDPA